MSSDIQKLRRLAQAALVAPDGLSAEWMDRLGQFQESVSPAAIIELLDRLEAADRAWKGVGKSCWDLTEKVIPNIREQLESAEKERDALRAKIETMERQEPVAWYSKQYGFVYMSRHHSQFEHGSILYLRNGTPAWRIEGSAKVALLDIASLPHGTVFYAAPGAKGE